MTNSPTTRNSLLLRLRDANDLLAWDQFVGLYAPLVYMSPQSVNTPELRQGEWTAEWHPISDRQYHIVVQRLAIDDRSVPYEALAPDQFRSSEIGFRVVTELQTGVDIKPATAEKKPASHFFGDDE